MMSVLLLVILLGAGAVGAEPPPSPPAADKAAIESANRFVERANKFVQGESLPRAKAEYLKALKIYPKHVDALYNLAVVCERLGQREEAVGYYRQYLEILPRDADVWTQLGVLYDQDKKTDEARAAYEKALASDPKFARAHHNLGVLLKERRDFAGAEQHLRECLALEEAAGHRNGDAYYSLGLLHLERLQVKEAKQCLNKAIETDPNVVYYNNAMGDVYLLEQQPDVAAEYFRKALARDPKYPLAYSGLGDAQQALGQRQEALDNYRKALELRPDYHVVDFKLGMLLADTDRAAAIKHLEKYLASAKNPKFEQAAAAKLAALKQTPTQP